MLQHCSKLKTKQLRKNLFDRDKRQTYMRGENGVQICVVACHWNPGGDHTDDIRLDALSKIAGGVFSVSKGACNTDVHVQGDIKSQNTWKEIYARQPDVIILDYFWLQKNWLTLGCGYGDKWVDDIDRFFVKGGMIAILPNDVSGEMQYQINVNINKATHADACLISYDDAYRFHPLWISTCMAETDIRNCKHIFLQNKINHTNKIYLSEKPFFFLYNKKLFSLPQHAQEWLEAALDVPTHMSPRDAESYNLLSHSPDNSEDVCTVTSMPGSLLNSSWSSSGELSTSPYDSQSTWSTSSYDSDSIWSDSLYDTESRSSGSTSCRSSDTGLWIDDSCTQSNTPDFDSHIIKTSEVPCAGRGLFACRDMEQGEYIGEYSGKVVTRDEYESCPNQDYMFQVNCRRGVSHYIDGRDGGKVALINGACDGQEGLINTEAYQNRRRIFYRTTCPVSKGQEFILHYGSNYW